MGLWERGAAPPGAGVPSPARFHGLLGRNVRFDGGHKHDPFLTDTVGPFVTYVPVCPEVEVGMGTPRESIRLERYGDVVRLVAPKSQTDHTEVMAAYARRRVDALATGGSLPGICTHLYDLADAPRHDQEER